jgi:hypothetical protein
MTWGTTPCFVDHHNICLMFDSSKSSFTESISLTPCKWSYPHHRIIFELLKKIERILGFLSGVVLLFMFQYLMGYVETCQCKTYSNGEWDFHATYVCIKLRLGYYPFQKFRMTPRRFGVKPKNNTKNGVSFEPWILFRKRRIYLKYKKLKRKLLEFVMLPSISSRSREETI